LDGPLHAAYVAARRASGAVPDRFSLEWHHGVAACQLLRTLKLTQGLEPADVQHFEALIVEVVGATDLSRHQELYNTFQATAEALWLVRGGQSQSRDHETEAQVFRLQAMQWLLKCADLANTMRPPMCQARWDNVAFEEFHCEGDELLARGLIATEELPPMHDRRDGKRQQVSEDFWQSIVLPTFELLREYLRAIPELKSEMATECLALARARLAMVQGKKRRGHQGWRTGRPALLGVAIIMIPVLQLMRWSMFGLSMLVPHAKCPGASLEIDTAWVCVEWRPPLWSLISIGLLCFPLVTLWEIRQRPGTCSRPPSGAMQQRLSTPEEVLHSVA